MNLENKQINIKSNSPTIVYIGIPFESKNEWSILDSNFVNTQRYFSVLKLPQKLNINMKALSSQKYIIFQRKFEQQDIDIKIDVQQGMKLNWVLFYKQNINVDKDFISCGGEVQQVQNPKGKWFKQCSQSSTYLNGDYRCENGLNGELSDENGKIWASDNEGPGAFILIEFQSVVQITGFQYLNRESISQRTKELTVEFSDGVSKKFEIKNHKQLNVIQLENSIVSSFIKFTISETYSMGNNGGGFVVFGVECQQNKLEEKQMESVDIRVIKLKCLDNMNNVEKLQEKSIGREVSVFCSQSCEEGDYQIYGESIFSGDSSICKSGYYSGLIHSQGGVMKLKMVEGLEVYSSGKSRDNKISSSYQKGQRSKLGFTVSAVANSNIQRLQSYFKGQQLDVYDDKLRQWLEGRILNIESVSVNVIKLELGKEGYSTKFNEFLILDLHSLLQTDKIDYCGLKLNQRHCEDNSKPHSHQLLSHNICFTLQDHCQDSQDLVDNGDIYARKHTDLYFGWNRRLNDNLRLRTKGNTFLENNLILFPPNKHSLWCTQSHLDCELAYWQIQLSNAKYHIKIMLGDSHYNARYFININDVPVVRNMYLSKNQWYTSETEIKVTNNIIKVSADCDKDCAEIWSRMSYIQIRQLPQEIISDEKVNGLTKLGCGVSFKGGRCENGGDTENCIYENLAEKGLEYCNKQLRIIKIPVTYHCLELVNMYKCIQDQYISVNECKLNCPAKCEKNICK